MLKMLKALKKTGWRSISRLALMTAAVFFVVEAAGFAVNAKTVLAATSASKETPLLDGEVGRNYSDGILPLNRSSDGGVDLAVRVLSAEVTDGELPEGLGIRIDNDSVYEGRACGRCVISGVPEKAGTYVFHVTLPFQYKEENTGDRTGEIKSATIIAKCRLTVNSNLPYIETDSLPKATVSENYSASLEAKKFKDDQVKWSITDGSLPDGLSLEGAKITGTPAKEGEYAFTVKAEGKNIYDEDAAVSKELKIKVRKKGDDDDHHDHHDDYEKTPTSWELNPNEKRQLVITYTGLEAGTCAGYQEQGAVARSLLSASRPAGFNEAFTFNLLNKDRQPQMTLKNGSFTLYIPSEYIKAGRQYGLLAIDNAGNILVLNDTDADPATVTVNVNHTGYAFELIYKD